MARSAGDSPTPLRQLPTPLVAALVLAFVVIGGNAALGWEGSPTETGTPIVAGQEAAVDDTDTEVVAPTQEGPRSLTLVEVTSGASPNTELMAKIGTHQGRFFVVSAGPGRMPGPEGSTPPPSDTLYIFDGATWTYHRLNDPFTKSYLLPEEIEEIQAGGPYDVGFLGSDYGVEASFGDSTYRIREPSLQSQRAKLTALVAQDPEGERTEQTLSEMLGRTGIDHDGYIMAQVAGGDFGIVVVATKTVDEVGHQLIAFSPDGETWSAQPIGEARVYGIIVGTNAFLVLGSYGDGRVNTDPSPVFMGQYRVDGSS